METNAQTTERSWIAQRLESDGPDLLQMWQTIWRRKWSILSLMLIVMMVAALIAFSITPIYRAGATLLIEQKQANVVSIEQVYGLEGTGNEYLQTQFELLKSRALAERVVKQLNLTTHPEFDPRQQPEPLIDIGALLASFNIGKAIPATLPEDLEEGVDPTEAQIFDQEMGHAGRNRRLFGSRVGDECKPAGLPAEEAEQWFFAGGRTDVGFNDHPFLDVNRAGAVPMAQYERAGPLFEFQRLNQVENIDVIDSAAPADAFQGEFFRLLDPLHGRVHTLNDAIQ